MDEEERYHYYNEIILSEEVEWDEVPSKKEMWDEVCDEDLEKITALNKACGKIWLDRKYKDMPAEEIYKDLCASTKEFYEDLLSKKEK